MSHDHLQPIGSLAHAMPNTPNQPAHHPNGHPPPLPRGHHMSRDARGRWTSGP